MENFTKKQVIIRWVVGFVIGIILIFVCIFSGDFASMESTEAVLLMAFLMPVLMGWECFAISLCWKDMFKYAFTFRFIRMLGCYFSALGKSIVITIKVLTARE